MADIFISYASEDRTRVEPLAKTFEDQGWSVWWDRTIPPGKSFDQVIQEAITAAKCVVVLWSKKSIISDWVKEEATIGKRSQILVPAKIDSVEPPLGFGLIQAADLTDWEPEKSHAGFEGFLSAISDILGHSPEREKGDQGAEIPESSLERPSEVQSMEREIPQPPPGQPIPAKVKPSELKPDAKTPTEPSPPKPRKTSNALKFGAVASVVVLFIVGIWWWVSGQHVYEVSQTEQVQQGMEELYAQVLNLENAIMRLDKPEQIEELYRQEDTLNQKVEAFSEKAMEVGLGSPLEALQNRFKGVKKQLANKGMVFP